MSVWQLGFVTAPPPFIFFSCMSSRGARVCRDICRGRLGCSADPLILANLASLWNSSFKDGRGRDVENFFFTAKLFLTSRPLDELSFTTFVDITQLTSHHAIDLDPGNTFRSLAYLITPTSYLNALPRYRLTLSGPHVLQSLLPRLPPPHLITLII